MYQFTTKDVLCLYPRNLLGCKMIHTFILSLSCNRLQLLHRLLMVLTTFAKLFKWLSPLANIPRTNNLPILFHFFIACPCYPIGSRKKTCNDRPGLSCYTQFLEIISTVGFIWLTDSETLVRKPASWLCLN
jgi:hypothetical protein